ncbi:peroxiredoxin (plasmid) [Deinococcus sp. KNUC1210]|uniref:peroxiredoxin n=1 Tax=Deinococcus sp. KNUC1210 TaxID=2917691 RepID=UPI001EEF8BBB|nr:peroxiredoxin [Deinococcus sp. KNUC1210]ULH13857.1 peroxiredoxin [Deinococcus sp. KNUC1210]
MPSVARLHLLVLIIPGFGSDRFPLRTVSITTCEFVKNLGDYRAPDPLQCGMALKIGDPAPPFLPFITSRRPPETSSDEGWTVLFFFPRGNHPHCVMESRRFQTLLPEFEQLGVQVIGVSVDNTEQQQYFRDFCVLKFPLISDAAYKLSQQYGVLETLEVEGENVTFARRETFLIGPEGHVQYHWTDVDPDTHASTVLADLRQRLPDAQ